MNILSYERKRNQFLKCESELSALLFVIASGEGDMQAEIKHLEAARDAAVEACQAYTNARNSLIAAFIDANTEPKKRQSIWPSACFVYMGGHRGHALTREGVIQRPTV